MDPSQQPPPDQRPRLLRNDRPPVDDRPAYGLPSVVSLKPGTYVTVRVNQALTTDHNQPGDSFSASLVQPIVADGIVVANQNQTVYGRVAEVQRQSSDHPSRLGIELTQLTMADGTQVPIRSQLISRQGGRMPAGDQAGTVIGTSAAGATIGAIAGWGTGAAIGGGVGAAVGLAAVMLTRNHPTVVYPETALTFRIESPVEISTSRAPQAFRYVGPEDYNQPYQEARLQARPAPMPGPAVGPAPGPCYGCMPPAYYGPSWYPYYWGTGVYIGVSRPYGYYHPHYYPYPYYRRYR
jgi:hypothetical protein